MKNARSSLMPGLICPDFEVTVELESIEDGGMWRMSGNYRSRGVLIKIGMDRNVWYRLFYLHGAAPTPSSFQ